MGICSGISGYFILIKGGFANEESIFIDVSSLWIGIEAKEDMGVCFFNRFMNDTQGLGCDMFDFGCGLFLLGNGVEPGLVGSGKMNEAKCQK